ncbi:hypothetical protein MMC29_000998 [Sticta canariensis]|nr:hypothetical protein [Sticta canariensis]
MGRDDKDKANGPSTTGGKDPASTQFIKNRGKSKSPPWHRVVVLDSDRNTVEVKKKKKLDLDDEDYQIFELPSGLSHVTIFLDSQTQTMPTTEETTDGDSNVKLAKIHLNKLGFSNSVLRSLGQLSTLYVKKIKPYSESSPNRSSPDSVGGSVIA